VRSSGYRGRRSRSALTRRRSRRRGRRRTARHRLLRRRYRRIPHRSLGRRSPMLDIGGTGRDHGEWPRSQDQQRVPTDGRRTWAARLTTCRSGSGAWEKAPVRTAVRTIRPRKLGTAGVQRSRVVTLKLRKALVSGHKRHLRALPVICGKPREEHYGSEGWGFESLPAHQNKCSGVKKRQGPGSEHGPACAGAAGRRHEAGCRLRGDRDQPAGRRAPPVPPARFLATGRPSRRVSRV